MRTHFAIRAIPPSSDNPYLSYEVVEMDPVIGVAPSAGNGGFLTGPRTWERREDAEEMVGRLTGWLRGYDTTRHTGV